MKKSRQQWRLTQLTLRSQSRLCSFAFSSNYDLFHPFSSSQQNCPLDRRSPGAQLHGFLLGFHLLCLKRGDWPSAPFKTVISAERSWNLQQNTKYHQTSQHISEKVRPPLAQQWGVRAPRLHWQSSFHIFGQCPMKFVEQLLCYNPETRSEHISDAKAGSCQIPSRSALLLLAAPWKCFKVSKLCYGVETTNPCLLDCHVLISFSAFLRKKRPQEAAWIWIVILGSVCLMTCWGADLFGKNASFYHSSLLLHGNSIKIILQQLPSAITPLLLVCPKSSSVDQPVQLSWPFSQPQKMFDQDPAIFSC